LKLTDDILKTIEHSECEELAGARQIMKRLRTRKLYRFVDEFLIPAGMEQYLTKVNFDLCPDELIVWLSNPVMKYQLSTLGKNICARVG
jgi:hypothetical protein